MRYCPHCGAANEEQDGRCFACARSLTGPLEEEQETLLQGRYQIQTQIGSGGYGAVYRALDRQDHEHTVAIKSINLKGLQPGQVIEATDGFNRERQLLSQLNHQHLPQVYDHFTDPDHWYLVIQYIEGTTLEEYLRKTEKDELHATRTLPLDEVLALALQLCEVLHYLHTRTPPVIYRDLKPSNIMRTPQGQLYLIDFGIARHYKAGQSKDTIPLGSPGYAAPEQYGKAQTTPQADIYSLGALLHQMLSGNDPSEAPFSFTPLRAYGEKGFTKLADLIARMVNLDASQRPENVQVVKQRLEESIDLQEETPAKPIQSVATGQGAATTFTPAQPGSQAYSTAYYVPGQTQQQLTNKKKANPTRRRVLQSFAAAAIGYAGIAAYAVVRDLVEKNNQTDDTRSIAPGPPTGPSPSANLTGKRIATSNKQVSIVALDTSRIVGYDTLHFASVDETGLISLWDEQHKSKYQIEMGQPVHSLLWSPNPYDTYLLAATDYDVYRIPLLELKEETYHSPRDSWNVTLMEQPDAPITNVEFSNDPSNILVIDRTGNVTIYTPDPNSSLIWKQIGRIPGNNTDMVSVGHDTIIGSSLAILSDTNKVALWFTNPTQKLQTASVPLSPSDGAITAFSWNPYASDVAIGTEKGSILLWDPSLPPTWAKRLHERPGTTIHAISWYANERVSMIVATNHGVSIWDYFARKLNATNPNIDQAAGNVKAIAVTGHTSIVNNQIQTNTEYALVRGEKFVEFWR